MKKANGEIILRFDYGTVSSWIGHLADSSGGRAKRKAIDLKTTRSSLPISIARHKRTTPQGASNHHHHRRHNCPKDTLPVPTTSSASIHGHHGHHGHHHTRVSCDRYNVRKRRMMRSTTSCLFRSHKVRISFEVLPLSSPNFSSLLSSFLHVSARVSWLTD